MDEKTSETLLNRYQTGSDSAAAFEIHSRYQTRLVSLAKEQLMGVLRSKIEAEDISQETFAAFFALADRNEVRWQKQGDLWRLLAGIAGNKVKQTFAHYSQQKRLASDEVQITALTDPEIRSDSITALGELVEECVVNEKPLLKSVLLMRLAGHTTSEIAEKLGRSPRTIRRLIETLKTKVIARYNLLGEAFYQPTRSVIPFANKVSYDDFHLQRMIGEGSFSKVYLAKQISLDRFVAIKAIRKRWLGDDRVRRTFEREVELLARTTDPNIVRTYGMGHLPNGGCFLVLQWIDGKSLSTAIESSLPADRVRWNQQLCNSIKNLHSQGIAHGDLKLDNILINRAGDVRIVDFGLGCSPNTDEDDVFARDLMAVEQICNTLTRL